MKYIRPAIIVAFLAVTIVFVINWHSEKKEIDRTYPEIEIGDDILEVSVKENKENLFNGVIAKDEKDGDLTNGIIIESISKFVDKENHICNITYAVTDSDNNVAKKTRKIKFIDYEEPKFALSQPLCFDVGSDIKPIDVIGAVDDYDGDISRDVKILSSTVSTGTAGEYTVTAQVTNSLGDTAKLKANVIVRPKNNLSPIIELKQNIVYLKKGEEFNEKDYIAKIRDRDGKILQNETANVVSSSVNTKKAGSYSVEYAVNSSEDNATSTYLTVVVEE